MSQERGEAVCEICGSVEFSSQDGFYYCSVCNTQSQQIREYAEDEEQQFQRLNRVTEVGILGNKPQKSKSNKKEKKALLTSWEMLNVALHKMTERLIELGFPSLLRDKVFQLWKLYLTRRNVILCENDDDPIGSRSSVSANEPVLNLESFYNLVKKHQLRRRKRRQHFHSYLARKRAETRMRRSAFESTYMAHKKQQSVTEKGDLKTVNDIVEKTQSKKSTSFPIRLTPAAIILRRSLNKMFGFRRSLSSYGLKAQHALEAEHFTLNSALVLLFIACRRVGSRVVFTDLLRLVNDGTLYEPIYKSRIHDTEGPYRRKSNRFLRITSLKPRTCNAREYAQHIQRIIRLLRLKRFQYPRFQEFLPKFVHDSALPLEFQLLLCQMRKAFKGGMGSEQDTCPWKILIEVKIVSMIGLLLLMLFGMDDVTEKHQSRFAATVNQILSPHLSPENPALEWTELFDIHEWFQHMRYRSSFLAQEQLTPMMFSFEKPPNLVRTNYTVALYDYADMEVDVARGDIEPRSGSPSVQVNDEPSNRDEKEETILKRIFRDATLVENGVNITEVSHYVSIPFPFQTVREQYQRAKPNVAYNYDLPILFSNFEKKRIDFIYKPEKYIPLLEKAGYKVIVLPGLMSQYKKPPKIKPKTLLLFQPYKKFNPNYDEGGISNSFQFVLDHLSIYIHQLEHYTEVNKESIVKYMVRKLGVFYSRKCHNFLIPLFLGSTE